MPSSTRLTHGECVPVSITMRVDASEPNCSRSDSALLRTRSSSRIAPALSSTQYRLHLSPKSNPITNGALDDDCLVTADSVRCLIAVSSQVNPQPKDYCRISEARQLHFYLHFGLTLWGCSRLPQRISISAITRKARSEAHAGPALVGRGFAQIGT